VTLDEALGKVVAEAVAGKAAAVSFLRVCEGIV